jgi:hypothetical protein
MAFQDDDAMPVAGGDEDQLRHARACGQRVGELEEAVARDAEPRSDRDSATRSQRASAGKPAKRPSSRP